MYKQQRKRGARCTLRAKPEIKELKNKMFRESNGD